MISLLRNLLQTLPLTTTIGQGRQRTLLLAVYRPDWADTADTEALCDCIDRLVSRYDNVIMAGDFNFPGMQWSTPGLNDDTKRESILRYLVIEHHLTQLVRQASRYMPSLTSYLFPVQTTTPQSSSCLQ